ncbi:MAG: integral membrane protein MviN, partial [uncultured bacterium]
MIRELMRKLSASIFGGAFIIGVASVASRLMGLVRDNLLAKTFGASAELDIYNAAFKVPDFLFNIIVLGALSASFIPVFIQQRESGDTAAWRLASTVLNYLLL